MRSMFGSLAAASALAVACLVAAPATAGGNLLQPGTKAPEFKGKEFINTTSVDLQTLAGRVVLLEIFRTW